MSSTTAPGTELRSMDRRPQDRKARRVILSSYLGSTIEYYDFLLSASALVFPHVFFQDLDPVAGVIASCGTFAAGYLARPLGGAIFGHFGDKLGRKKMLILPMFVMGIGSTLIGLIPSSASIGSWGAILLILLRVFQGIPASAGVHSDDDDAHSGPRAPTLPGEVRTELGGRRQILTISISNPCDYG